MLADIEHQQHGGKVCLASSGRVIKTPQPGTEVLTSHFSLFQGAGTTSSPATIIALILCPITSASSPTSDPSTVEPTILARSPTIVSRTTLVFTTAPLSIDTLGPMVQSSSSTPSATKTGSRIFTR